MKSVLISGFIWFYKYKEIDMSASNKNPSILGPEALKAARACADRRSTKDKTQVNGSAVRKAAGACADRRETGGKAREVAKASAEISDKVREAAEASAAKRARLVPVPAPVPQPAPPPAPQLAPQPAPLAPPVLELGPPAPPVPPFPPLPLLVMPPPHVPAEIFVLRDRGGDNEAASPGINSGG
jgi:hypothetical protein